MAEVIKQQPPVTEQVTQEALNRAGYKAGANFVKAITDKVSGIVESLSAYNIKQQFKDKRAIGIAGDAVKSLFRKRKQTPIVEETLERTDTSKQVPVQGTLKGILPDKTDIKTTEQQKEIVPTPLKTDIASETNKSSQQLELPGMEQPEQPKEKKLIQTEEKARIVLIGGITDEGIRNFKEKLPDLFEEIFKKLPKTESKPQDLKTQYSEKGLLGMLPKGLLAMGGGLALLLGGLAALVTGLQTDGPFKGLLKIFSKVGLQGGLKLLEKGAKAFVNTLKSFIDTPVKLVDEAATGLKGLFKNVLPKGISNILKGSAGLLSRLIVGVGKFLKPILTKIPLIGTLISWGFAYTRFKSGDVVGGIIDVLSGLVGLLSLTGVGAGVAIPIQIGLDVLNAFLDYKTGGATAETSQKKTGILKEWMLGLGKWFKDNAENFPLIGTLIKTGRLFGEGKWTEGLVAFAKIIPGTSWLLDLVGFTEEKQLANAKASQDIIGDLWNWMQTTMWEKITSAASWLVDGVKNWWSNLSWDPRTWVGKTPEPPEIDIPNGRKSARGSKPKMAEGGVVEIGEAGDEVIASLGQGGVLPGGDVSVVTKPTTVPLQGLNEKAIIPIEKYFNGKDFALSNNTLSQIASNTGSTNDGLKALGQAILKLAQVFNEKGNTSSNNISINGQQQNQYPSASQIAANNIDPIRQIRAQFAI